MPLFPRLWLVVLSVFWLSIANGVRGAAVDGWGDVLPARVKVRIGTARFRHGDAVTAAVFSSDGRSIATASRDGTISLWAADSGKEVLRLRGHAGPVLAVAFTFGGRRLVSGGADGTVRVWCLSRPTQSGAPEAGAEVSRLRVADEEVQAVAITANGSTLAAATVSGVIALWDLKAGKERHLPRGGQSYNGVDGKIVGHLGDQWPRLRPGGSVYCLALSNDGNQLAANDGNRGVALWDTAKGEEARVLDRGAVESLAFTPDGRTLAAGFHDHHLALYDTRAAEEIRVLVRRERQQPEPTSGFLSVSFSADGRLLASGGTDRVVRVWDTRTGRQVREGKGHRGQVTVLNFAPDGKQIVSGGTDNTVRLWDAATGRERTPQREPATPLTCVSLTADGRTLVTIQSPDRIAMCSTTDARWLPLPASLASQRVSAASFSPDGKRLALSVDDDRLRFWDLGTNELRAVEGEAPRRLERLAWSRDGQTLASVDSDHHIDIWNPIKIELLQHMGLQEDAYLALAFDRPGQRLATASESEALRLWDAPTGVEKQRITGRFAGALALSFSADGRALWAAGRDGRVRLWELAANQPRRTFTVEAAGIASAAFTADGRFLATGGEDGVVRLWDTFAGKERQIFRGHRGAIAMLSFAERASLLASASRDTTALVWDLTGLLHTEAPPRLDLSEREIETLAEKLAGDAPTAYEALQMLVRAPGQVVPYLRGRLRPVRAEFVSMIADLDSEHFTVREKATRQLAHYGRVAEKALRRTLADKPSLEVRRRIEHLLAEMRDGPDMVMAAPREVRSVELLEAIGGDEARRLLQTLAGGIDEAELTQQAKESLARLQRRRAP